MFTTNIFPVFVSVNIKPLCRFVLKIECEYRRWTIIPCMHWSEIKIVEAVRLEDPNCNRRSRPKMLLCSIRPCVSNSVSRGGRVDVKGPGQRKSDGA
ncbi:uncharacterized protein LOC111264991 isoform X2 [Varroa jacobsoni]|uniref:uncharacterized protein LOC111264991 isoform X2 n=1 Tax=Varroa jacobsoni TaxID=62625 RepID=UPI000BF295DE|nr:uncharacterized protein LOC111264991 isoform X2 [Varroa jacobsoni]